MKQLMVIVVAILLATGQTWAYGVVGKLYGASTGGGAVSNLCAGVGNQLDYSQANGCNLVQMMTGRP